MTLCDAFTIHTRKLHFRTLRPYLAFRVCNAANTNSAPLPRAGGGLIPATPTNFPSVVHDASHKGIVV
jgi:hypothetical protein